MARNARRELADLRAMEEETERMELHGRGKTFHGAGMVGAGGVPSMGVSQFRGGAKKGRKVHYESEEDDDMEGGNIGSLLGALGRLGSRARVPRVPSTALTRYVPPRTSTALTTGLARPSMPQSWYANLMRQGRTGSTTAAATGARSNAFRSALSRLTPSATTAQRIATAVSLGVPLAMLGDYLANSGASGDGGYYDDYAGDVTTGPLPEEPPVGPDGGPIIDYGLPDVPMPPPSGGPRGRRGRQSDLPFYLQTGNIGTEQIVNPLDPNVYAGMGKAKRRSSGKADGRSARAAVVKQVMRERGVSLAEASRIVKAEGLY